MRIRPECTDDFEAVRRVHDIAFGQRDEGAVVERLREAGVVPLVSLVACADDGTVVAHAAFSPVQAEGMERPMALGPIAVLPAQQKRGVGRDLIRAGCAACREKGADAVFVLGDAAYYRRRGFEPAAPWDYHFRSRALDPHFLVQALREGVLAQAYTGPRWVTYHEAFEGV